MTFSPNSTMPPLIWNACGRRKTKKSPSFRRVWMLQSNSFRKLSRFVNSLVYCDA